MSDFDEGKTWIALIVGILATVLGLIPLLNKLGVFGFNLPNFILKLIPGVAIWLIAGIALILFVESMMEDETWRVISIIVAFVILGLGIVQILNSLGVIGFGLPLSDTVYYILFIVEGLFLMIATFAMD